MEPRVKMSDSVKSTISDDFLVYNNMIRDLRSCEYSRMKGIIYLQGNFPLRFLLSDEFRNILIQRGVHNLASKQEACRSRGPFNYCGLNHMLLRTLWYEFISWTENV